MAPTTTRKRPTQTRYLRPGDTIHLPTGSAVVVDCTRTGPGAAYQLTHRSMCTFETTTDTLPGGALIDRYL